MRVFVSGAEGQLARSILECATANTGITIINAGRPKFDLARPLDVEAAVIASNPDIVVNTAAYTAVDKAETEPDIAAAVNQAGAAVMARAAAKLNVPIIQISTDYVFKGTKSTAYVETDPTGPMGIYGQSKLAGEKEVVAANPWHVILRTSWVYSPFGNNFVKTMIRLGQQKETLGVVSDQVGNPTYAPDLAGAILVICSKLLQDRKLSGIYHAAGTGETSWHDFAKHIFALQDKWGFRVPVLNSIRTSDYPTAARRPENSRLDCSKMKSILGIELPAWQNSLLACMQRLRDEAKTTIKDA
jgi:dTDP-4-dehydrorhamnose reductase